MEGGRKGTFQETIQVCPVDDCSSTGKLAYLCFFPSSRKVRQWPEAGTIQLHFFGVVGGCLVFSGGCHLTSGGPILSIKRGKTPRPGGRASLRVSGGGGKDGGREIRHCVWSFPISD